ncbi:MAG: NUDIX hydrolase [Planctomycetota bacterium]
MPDAAEPKEARILSSKTLATCGPFRLDEHEVILPTGRQARIFVAEHPGSVVIVAIKPPFNLILIRQYRFPAREWLWELPAGTLSPGEEPEACARRELSEEAGYEADRWTLLADFFTAPGFTSERMRMFLARNIHKIAAHPEADEVISEVKEVPVEEAVRWIRDGKIRDGKTIAGIYEARDFLAQIQMTDTQKHLEKKPQPPA